MNGRSKSNKEDHNFHLDEQLILDFFLGFLSAKENEKILSHLTDCPACEKLFQERASESEHFAATRILRFLPDGKLAVERRGTALRTKRWEIPDLWDYLSKIWGNVRMGFSRPRFRLAGGLAAVTAIFVIVWLYGVRAPDTQQLYLLRPYSFQLQSREISSAVPNEELRAGLDAYNNKKFERAIELLQKAEVSEQSLAHDTIRKVYLGSALAWNGDYEEAVSILEMIPFPLVPPEWSREAHWTLYIALKETGRDESADSLLQILSSKPGEVGDRAREILEP